MKSLITIAILASLAFALSGCMSWLYEPTVDDEGNVQYVDEEKTREARAAGLIEPDEVITSNDSRNKDGTERDVHLSNELKPGALNAIKKGTGYGDMLLPGLGGLLGSIVAGGLLVLRGRKKARQFAKEIGVEKVGKVLLAKGATVLSQVVKDFKDGMIDLNKDGQLDSAELKAYVIELAEQTGLDARFAEELVKIGTSSWDLSQRQAALEALATSS